MKKILFSVLLFGLLLSRISFADENENRIITELKTWKYSVGDCAYLMKAKEFYYGVGMEKDLGLIFNDIPKDWIYIGPGYLCDKPFGGTTDEIGKKTYFYIGISGNAGRAISESITYLGKKLNANFIIPKPINELLVKVGVDVAKKIDGDFWSSDGVWDWGWKISVIRIEF